MRTHAKQSREFEFEPGVSRLNKCHVDLYQDQLRSVTVCHCAEPVLFAVFDRLWRSANLSRHCDDRIQLNTNAAARQHRRDVRRACADGIHKPSPCWWLGVHAIRADACGDTTLGVGLLERQSGATNSTQRDGVADSNQWASCLRARWQLGSSVRAKHASLLRHFILKHASFYQDRLRTNIGKAPKT